MTKRDKACSRLRTLLNMVHWKHLTSKTGPDSKRNVHEMPIDMLQFKTERVILGYHRLKSMAHACLPFYKTDPYLVRFNKKKLKHNLLGSYTFYDDNG